MGTKLVNISIGKFDFDLHRIGLHRKTLMGLAALSIFIMHFTAIGALQFTGPLALAGKVLAAWTAVGVEIFCLVSGYGIFYSLSKRPSLIHYFEKRLERVIIPFLLIMVPGNLFLLRIPLNECLFRWSTLYYWLEKNDGTWFVSFIILMYALSPLFYRVYGSGTESQIIGKHCVFMVILWGGDLCGYKTVSNGGRSMGARPIQGSRVFHGNAAGSDREKWKRNDSLDNQFGSFYSLSVKIRAEY